jgi:hypothetical protein
MNSRPGTVREVARQAETLRDFGHLCQDWLHALRRVSSRNAAAVDLPLRLRAGRPRHTPEQLRRANAERQRRFRESRALELELLRSAVRAL